MIQKLYITPRLFSDHGCIWLNNNVGVKIVFLSDKCKNYFSLNLYTVYCQMHLFCAVLDQKIELVILKQQFGGFSQESGYHYSISVGWKNEQANLCCFFFTFEPLCPYFSLNLRHIEMSHIHCEMQYKLSKTVGVTIGVYGINNYFTVPYTESTSNILLLDKLTFLRFSVPLPLPEE